MAGIEDPQVVLSNSFVVAATWRNLFVEHYRARGGAKEMRVLHDQQRAFLARLGRPIVTLAVVPGSVIGNVDGALRDEVKNARETIHPHVKAGALALLADGFQGAIVRSILTSMNLFRRPPYPNKITDDIAGATRFVAEYVGAEGAPRATAAEIEEVHRKILNAPPR